MCTCLTVDLGCNVCVQATWCACGAEANATIAAEGAIAPVIQGRGCYSKELDICALRLCREPLRRVEKPLHQYVKHLQHHMPAIDTLIIRACTRSWPVVIWSQGLSSCWHDTTAYSEPWHQQSVHSIVAGAECSVNLTSSLHKESG